MRIHPQTEFNLPAFNYRRVLVVLIFSFFIVLLLLLHSKFPIFMDEAIYSDITNRFIQGLGMSTALYEDFILFSYFANSQIYEYVRINTEEVILDNSVLGNRFSIFLIKLKPLEERVLF